MVDHIDRDIYNNKKINLRVVTQSQNAMNRGKRTGSLYSKYKGVTWSKASRKYTAQITIRGKSKNLGFFKDEDDAAIAYNLAALELQGEFAVLNDININ